MKSLSIAVALAVSDQAPAPPADDVFCQDIQTVARGADEARPFRSLVDRDFQPRLGRADCFFSDAGSYTCGHNLATPEETRESYAARIQACLPGSVRTTTGSGFEQYEIVRHGRFQARIAESGTDRAHVGRSIDIYLESTGATGKKAAGS